MSPQSTNGRRPSGDSGGASTPQTPPGQQILEVSGLTVRFGGVLAVDDVSFDLRQGEILGVIGPNGAGKTTVFDAISGFVPSRGHVRLDGHDISGYSPEKRSRARLGRSFQDARLFPSLTVAETLAVSLERHMRAHDAVSTAIGAPWVRRAEKRVSRRVNELIELMGLGAFRDKFVSELSTGSRRIVDLAGILAHEPLVLLLDEPSSGIAQRETEALGPLLEHIRTETGASLLVIEHDMPLITSISDEILALETGAVLTRGKPAEVLADPRLVAAYLGTDQAVLERSGMRSEQKPVRAAAKRPPVAKQKAAAKKPAAGKKAVSQKAVAVKKAAKTTAKRAAASKTMPSRPIKATRKRTS
jgi:ABC-type branched-subunit amino acid transport system ATPase component